MNPISIPATPSPPSKRWQMIEDIYVLSPMQEGILFHTLFEPEEGMYCVQLSCLLKGELDVEKFKRAWSLLVERHGILRTSFVWKGLKRAHQVVHRSAVVRWIEQDWRGGDQSEQQK